MHLTVHDTSEKLPSRHQPTEEPMQTALTEELLANLGRAVVAAANLEGALSMVAGVCLDRNGLEVLGKPGEPLRAARASLAVMTDDQRKLFTSAIDAAETALRERHGLFHAMWMDQGETGPLPQVLRLRMRDFATMPTDATDILAVVDHLNEATRTLASLLTDLINGRLGPKLYLQRPSAQTATLVDS